METKEMVRGPITEVEGVRLLDSFDSLDYVPAEVSRLRGYGVDVAYDIETTGVDPLKSKMVAIQLKPKGRKATIIDVRHYNDVELMTLGSMLEPLFDGTVTLVGHNLKFDLEFALAQMGLGAHKVYDTMIAEQVIHGVGMSSAANKKLGLRMDEVGKRYGIDVHKEERNWFIDLDSRVEGAVLSQVGSHEVCQTRYYAQDGIEIDEDEISNYDDGEYERVEDCQDVADFAMVGGHKPWDDPFPPEQIRYMRQDVSVVHRIKESQQAAIEREGLWEVLDLEMRVIPALAGIEVYGVTINKDGWLDVIDRVRAQQDELEKTLHMGVEGQSSTGERYDGLDIHILKVRNERWEDKMRPYNEWVASRDLFINTRHAEWDEYKANGGHGDHVLTTPDGTFNLNVYNNWSEYKKAMLDWWYARHEKLTKPPNLKMGVNLGSWMQVRDGFNDLGIPVKGVSEEELEPYRASHPLVGVYIEYGHARKLTTVYGREKGKKEKSFVDLLDENNRLRASYQQIGADTERMSSYEPNFQQIPVEGIGAELRENVVPAPGFVFVDADFSNIELRIVAELSGDPFLLEAFASGRDVHAYTAGVMFKLRDEEITEGWTKGHDAVVGGRVLVGTSYRKVAKTINYALLYGAGIAKLASTLGVSQQDAKTLRRLYYDTFARAISWLNEQKSLLEQAMELGQKRVAAVTRAGWKRWFDIPTLPKHPANGKPLPVTAYEEYQEAMEQYRHELASIKRQLANTPIQGLSAAITKLAAALWYERVGYEENMKLVAIIHDEFLVECLPQVADFAAETLRVVMYEAMRHYLHVVDLGEINPVIASHWVH